MPDSLHLDDRIYNPYAVEDLAASHPKVFAAFKAWFSAVADFEEGPLNKLIAARGPEEVGRHRTVGEAVLAQLPEFTKPLASLIAALEEALSQEPFGSPGHSRLSPLLESARINHREYAERAPALAAEALASVESYAAAVLQAEALVKATAEKLEAIARASYGRTKKFADLHLMIEELRQTWKQLDAGLAPLSRQEARRIRGAEEQRMQKAAAALCKNLISAKARARAAGLLSPPDIQTKGDGVVDRFAVAVLRADYTAACSFFAPWLESVWTPETLQSRVEAEYSLIAREAGVSAVPALAEYQASSNPIDLRSLREIHDGSKMPIPAQVTAENFLAWVPLKLMPEEEDSYLTNIDYLLSLYVLTVRNAGKDGGGERIGYLLFGEQ